MNTSFFDQFALAIEEQKGVMKDLQEKKRELYRQVAELEGKNRELHAQVANLEEKNREWQRHVADLAGKDRQWHQQVAELEEKQRELSGQGAELEGKNRELHAQVAEREEKNREWQRQVANLEEKKRELQCQIADLKAGRGIFLEVCGRRFALEHERGAQMPVGKDVAEKGMVVPPEVLSRASRCPSAVTEQEYARAYLFFEERAGEEETGRESRRRNGVKRTEIDEAQQAVLRRELVGSYILD
jgi:hypothetical protein